MGRILRVFSSSLALALTIASLIICIILAYPENLHKWGASNYQTLAIIDTAGIETRTPQSTYHGLPDSHDYSKHKDFFALYIHRYCSGTKERDGKYKVNFCSDVGKELFDQYRVWKVWGVDLGTPDKKAENAIQETVGVSDIRTLPRAILGSFLASSALNGLVLITGFFALCTTWAKGVAVIFASLATLAAAITAIMAQILFPTLVKRTNGYRVMPKSQTGASAGVLVSELGKGPLAALWVLVVFGLLSTLLLAAALHSDRKARASKANRRSLNGDKDSRLRDYQLSPSAGKEPITAAHSVPRGGGQEGSFAMPGIIRRATGKLFGAARLSRYDDTSYETLRVAGAEPRGRSRSRDPSQDRGSPSEKSADTIVAPTDEERAARYEPYRHHPGP